MKKLLFAGLVIAAVCAFMFAAWIVFALSDLPDVSRLKHYRPAAAAEVLDKDDATLAQYFDRKFRIWVPIASLPDLTIRAVVTAEDDTFFEHKGVNYKATWDALVHDVQKRRFARGGSTITQQMIKNVLLSREKTITRKLREYVLARKAEELLTKRQILQIYLNEVEWGDNIYGIEAASRYYLDKHASELTLGESALLAGMLPNPHYYDPFKRPAKAKDRQEHVLDNMLQARIVTKDSYDAAIRRVELRREDSGRFYSPALKSVNGKPCYQHALEEILLRLFGDQNLYRGGWTIKTSIDKKLQDDMNGLEEAGSSTGVPDRVVVVKEGEEIRAIVCSPGKEAEVRDKLPFRIFSGPDYDVSTVPIDSITQKQIVLSVQQGK